MTPKQTIKLEGVYTLDGDLLRSPEITLALGQRRRPKKGQAKRFIGYLDYTKPLDDQFIYLSSLYAEQGLKNSYMLEHAGVYYSLTVTGINSVEIKQQTREPVLSYTADNREAVLV